MAISLLKHHYPIVILLVAVVGCAIAGNNLTQLLRFERSAIIDGELYRLLTAHIVHLNWAHTAMNAAAAIIGWYLFKDLMSNRQWLISLAGCALIISLLLFTVNGLQWYVGFSGIIHGVLLQGLMLDKRLTRVYRALIISALILKVGYEQWQGASSATVAMINGNVVVEAHLFGLIAGLLMLAIIKAAMLMRLVLNDN